MWAMTAAHYDEWAAFENEPAPICNFGRRHQRNSANNVYDEAPAEVSSAIILASDQRWTRAKLVEERAYRNGNKEIARAIAKPKGKGLIIKNQNIMAEIYCVRLYIVMNYIYVPWRNE